MRSDQRALMRHLGDTELALLLREIPGLADPWARIAKTSAAVLLSGNQRGRMALKTALVQRTDELARILAIEGYYGFAIDITRTGDADTGFGKTSTAPGFGDAPAKDGDADDEATLWAVAEEAGRRLGPNAASALLTAIAASTQVSVASIAAANLEALTARASQIWAATSERDLVEPLATVSDDGSPNLADGVRSPEQLLDVNARLSSEALVLAEAAVKVAAALRQGVPFDLSGTLFDGWSAAVRTHLHDVSAYVAVSDLASAEHGLRIHIADRDAAFVSQRQQAQAIRALLGLGLGNQADVLAAAHGYESAAALLAVTGPATERAEPGDGVEPAGDGEPVELQSYRAIADDDSADGPDEMPVTIGSDVPDAVVDDAPATVAGNDSFREGHASARDEELSLGNAFPEDARRDTEFVDEGPTADAVGDKAAGDASSDARSLTGEPADDEPAADQETAGQEREVWEQKTDDRGEGSGFDAIPIPMIPRDQSDEGRVSGSAPDGHVVEDAIICDDLDAAPAYHGLYASAIPDFPWEEGNPPLIAQLVDDGREASAVHVAQAKGEPSGRVRLLRLLTAVNHCSAGEIERLLPELIPAEEESATFGQEEYRVYVAAVARAAVTVGYAPVPIEQLAERAAVVGTPVGDLMAALAATARGGRRFVPSPLVAAEQDDLNNSWSSTGARATELLHGMLASTIKYHRATRVLQHLCRKEEPLGHALLAAEALAQRPNDPQAAEWGIVTDTARLLADRSAWDRLIDKADAFVSTKSQLRKSIDFGARDKLHDQLRRVSDLLVEFIDLREQMRTYGQADDRRTAAIHKALADIGDLAPMRTVGDAATHRLIGWLRSDHANLPVSASLGDLLSRALVAVTTLPLDDRQHPVRDVRPDELPAVIAPPDPDAIVRGYLGSGNLARAEELRQQWELGESDEWDDAFRRARSDSRRHHRRLVERVERAANRLRALSPDGAPSDLEAPLEAVKTPNPDRYDLAAAILQCLAVTAEVQLARAREGLRARVASAPISDEQRDRIGGLLDGEEALAVHFLTLAELGEPLPPPEAERDEDFPSFFPGAILAAADAVGDRIESVQNYLQTEVGLGPTPNERLQQGLRSWRSLVARRTAGPQFRESLADVVRMIGLIPKPTNWLTELHATFKAGYAVFRLRTEPVDTGYVAEIGSLAKGSFELTLVWDTVSPTRMLEFVPEARRNSPNIILYLGVLGTRQRADLRRLTREQNFNPVVIDAAVIGWLSTREEPSWRITQRITLPFTAFNPYKPYAAGEVPPEVFVGRTAERRSVTDPMGPWFVYGGRQLGKSALLRRVEKDFTERIGPDTKVRTGLVAVYMDLKVAGLQRPDELWRLMAERLRDLKILPQTTATRKEAVIAQLTDWFRADERNRLLLLLDEADNFLAADAEETIDGGPFQVLEGLKQIVLDTQRRFKPIFAGLHKVQRFHTIPNTAVVHGGREILVGPLDSADARRLVVKPLQALGYTFESPELVWRLLLFSNYIASFVQIVCEALVRYLAGRPLPAAGGTATITAADVDHVCNDPDVRAQLAERFRWTIGLDNRYLVIALVTALRSMDSATPDAFAGIDLREECEAFWPAAFGTGALTEGEFQTYLEELVGLGVLRRVRDSGVPRYGLRNANLVTMLGTSEQLNRELYEASRNLELDQEYNPAVNRALLETSAALSARRSPLSDEDLGRILDRKDRADQVAVVVGSAALGISDVPEALILAAKLRDVDVELVSIGDVSARLKTAPTKPVHLIVDLNEAIPDGAGLDSSEIDRLRERAAQWQRLTATIVLGSQYLPLPDFVGPDQVISLRRWSVAGLQAWRDSPFNTPELRTDLHRVTSGWPRLVERAMSLFDAGTSTRDVIEGLRSVPGTKEEARQMLADAGLDTDIAQTWATWFVRRAADGLVESMDVPAADLSEALGINALPVVERLETLDLVEPAGTGWVLDRVAASAASKLFSQ